MKDKDEAVATKPQPEAHTAAAHAPKKGGAPTEWAVSITSGGFSPARTECKVGDTVTWNNGPDAAHVIKFTAAPEGADVPSVNLLPNRSTSYTFKTAGTYEFCSEGKQAMAGTVVVS